MKSDLISSVPVGSPTLRFVVAFIPICPRPGPSGGEGYQQCPLCLRPVVPGQERRGTRTRSCQRSRPASLGTLSTARALMSKGNSISSFNHTLSCAPLVLGRAGDTG